MDATQGLATILRDGACAPPQDEVGDIFRASKAAIQYSEASMMKSRSRSVLDTPLEPVIGLAEGETRWRSMTIFARKRRSNPDSVIPGWSAGPDLRCAIAHRGISRFRVRCFASPRNDGCVTTAAPWLLRLDAGFARQPNPFFDVGVHQPRKLLGAVTRGLKALLDEEFFDLGRFKRLHDGLVELVDDRPRRIGRREHTVPSRYFVVSEASFRDRWYLRRDREPLAGTDAKCPHGAGADLR